MARKRKLASSIQDGWYTKSGSFTYNVSDRLTVEIAPGLLDESQRREFEQLRRTKGIARFFAAIFPTQPLRPPGATLLEFARFAFGPKKTERVFQQIVADTREEYYAQLQAGEKWGARVTIVRGWYEFAKAAGLFAVFRVMAKLGRKMIGG